MPFNFIYRSAYKCPIHDPTKKTNNKVHRMLYPSTCLSLIVGAGWPVNPLPTSDPSPRLSCWIIWPHACHQEDRTRRINHRSQRVIYP
ncbi:hypothetical protein CEXT_80721 [Caerostris extrusa]|uniref:Uncharacterized protein n=1 Tax=Caerostris extrusa TaxID=172846 RepID=A0AAV4MLH4_CAEEX|nr:hypothetical protein CEXT_80721 [Caerostris extrusa]